MLFELKSVFQNDGEEKQVEYNLDSVSYTHLTLPTKLEV